MYTTRSGCFLLRDIPKVRFIDGLFIALARQNASPREWSASTARFAQTVPMLLESFRTFCSCTRPYTREAWTLFWSRTRTPLLALPFFLHHSASSPVLLLLRLLPSVASSCFRSAYQHLCLFDFVKFCDSLLFYNRVYDSKMKGKIVTCFRRI